MRGCAREIREKVGEKEKGFEEARQDSDGREKLCFG